MGNDLWRWADPDGQQRRVRLDELRAALAGGHIAPNTPVWRAGWVGWQSAHEVPELQSSALAAANGVVPNIPPPPLAMVAVQHAFEATADGPFSQRPPSMVDEPPPPPTYVPVAVKPTSLPPPHSSSGRLPTSRSPADGTHAAFAATQPVTSSLPTTVGLPPPPEMLAMVEQHRAQQQLATKAPAIPGAAGNGTAVMGQKPASDPMIEELSGSALLDDISSRAMADTALAPDGSGAYPPPTNPVIRDIQPEAGRISQDFTGSIGLPRRRPQLTAIFDDLNELKAGRPPKNKLLIGVLAFFALCIGISFLAIVISLFRGKPSEVTTETTSRASPSSSVPAMATASPTESAPVVAVPPPDPPKEEPKPASTESSLGDCALAGEAHVVSPRAFVQSGVEAMAVPGAIALGFATDPRNGIGVTVDPASIGITTTVKSRAFGADARRMSPVLEKGHLSLVADNDRRGDALRGRRVVATTPPIDVGVADGAIVWAPHGSNSFAKLFPLDGDGNVDAIRAVPLGTTKGIAIAFRRGGNVLVGVAKGEAALTPEGSLGQIAGLGQVGSPAITTSGDAVIIAWSDRVGASDPWQIRWSKLAIGGAPDAPKTLAMPDGGLGVQSMSPSLAGLGAGRFVIAWSEGTPSHQVRAQSLGADGAPSGSALALSAAGVNAGQPQIAVGPDGRGVVAFLAAKGRAFEIHATPIACASK